ncbi:MAG: hypothetical protein NTV32_01715 [Gammaproteobacteria bacterium]|nr:hypothetical protein [Gammaproteobacteria bacterium]
MHPLKILSVSMLLAYASYAMADPSSNSGLESQPMSFQATYQQYNMPNDLQPLGTVTLEGLVNFTPNWYGGMGVDNGVSGGHSGYFALNFEGGYQHPIVGPIWIDLGSKVGAGGGHQTPVGSGLFYQPYAGLSYHFTHFNLGLDYTYVNFPSGSIHSSQAELVLTVPFTFDYGNASLAGTPFDTSGHSLAMGRDYFGLVGEAYFPASNVTNTSDQIDAGNIQLVGVEMGHYFTTHAFGFIQGTGAVHGHSNGYAALIVGPGYEIPVLNSVSLVGKLGVGSGGGAGINTGGGFIVEPTLGVDVLLTPSFSAELDGGYLDAPDGTFNAAVMSLILKYRFDNAYLADTGSSSVPSQLTYQGWRVRVLNETYFNPARTNSNSSAIQLANVNLDYNLNHYFYLTGQSAFAYSGYQVGGYFSGMIGGGVQLPIYHNSPVAVFAEALGGAAGGAGLDIGDGAMLEPLVGLNDQVTSSWGLQASVGRLISVQGGFGSTVMNAGVSYSFSTLSGR